MEAKAACSEIVDDPVYRKNFIRRARTGKLPPAVETMIRHHTKGKPTEHVELKADLVTAEAVREDVGPRTEGRDAGGSGVATRQRRQAVVATSVLRATRAQFNVTDTKWSDNLRSDLDRDAC